MAIPTGSGAGSGSGSGSDPNPPNPSLPNLLHLLHNHPLPNTTTYSYGTAGFRYPHTTLPPLMVRVGLFAALRSASLDGEGVGVMVTASHNGVNDNGVKMCDPDGGMLGGMFGNIGEGADEGAEGVAVRLANLRGRPEVAIDELRRLCRTIGWMDGPFGRTDRRPRMIVHVGHDTRPHSPYLTSLAVRAAQSLGATVINHGLLTTPQLHHIVMHSNPSRLPSLIPRRGWGERGYLDGLCWGYVGLIGTKEDEDYDGDGEKDKPRQQPTSSAGRRSTARRKRMLVVDGANGIGHPKVLAVRNKLHEIMSAGGGLPSPGGASASAAAGCCVDLVAVNGPDDGPLNEGCGAEYVQKGRVPPKVYRRNNNGGNNEGKDTAMGAEYGASLDGDADRVVFHYTARNMDARGAKFRLLDGDKIAVLVTQFVQEELDGLTSYLNSEAAAAAAAAAQTDVHAVNVPQIRCGVVQTSYANGASTSYLRNTVDATVVTAKTGVKYVHHAAQQHFDVGVYFEANGHGTVLFGTEFYELLGRAEGMVRKIGRDEGEGGASTCGGSLSDGGSSSGGSRERRARARANLAWQRLKILPGLINQAVGDALSDMLLVDAILYLKGWSVEDWDGLYEDMPSRQGKVMVADRSIITTNDSETRTVTPSNLQPALDAAMAALDAAAAARRRQGNATTMAAGGQESANATPPPPSRCFVRPSGTENAVRVYAEASTQEDADVLASEAAALVHKLCGGVGDPPRIIVRNRL